MSKASDRERESARDDLRNILKPGDTVYTVLRYVSRSGMSRGIDCYRMNDGSDPSWLSYMVSKAVGIPFNQKRECLSVGGCGMDMGFHVVYELSAVLYGRGSGYTFFCVGEACPSNDHTNERGQKVNYTVGREHSDGGYALRQRWI